MSKRLIIVLVLAFVVGLSLTAYAEVQNVKVSGDFTAVGAARNNLDLAKNVTSGELRVVDAANFQDDVSLFASITRLRIDADLTDNVAATVRLLNERDWNGEAALPMVANNNIGLNNAPAAINQVAVTVDLAYATLKEFLYSPLTLTIGRQNIRLNNGWIVGDPDTNAYSGLTAMAAGDLSAHKSFDAIHAILDYNPLVVDVVYAKGAEGQANLSDDISLVGINAAYALDKTTNLEGFFYSKTRGKDSAAATNVDVGNTTSFLDTLSNSAAFLTRFPGTGSKLGTDKVNVVGARVVNRTINNLTLDVAGAFQYGSYNPKFDPNARWESASVRADVAKRRAYGGEFVAIYDLKDCAPISKYHPMIMGAFVWLSGANRDRVGSKTYTGWDAMFEDQTFGHLTNAMFGFSNIKLAGLSIQAKPVEDITTKLDWSAAWFVKKFGQGRLVNLSGVSGARTFTMGNSSYAGQEIDLTVSYDYTEDVQFSLLGGVYLTGKAINITQTAAGVTKPHRANATELIGSMKVTF